MENVLFKEFLLPLPHKINVMIALFLPLVIGPWQIILIVLAILLLFGGKKIPELMRGLGSGIKEFKDASKEDADEKKIDEKK